MCIRDRRQSGADIRLYGVILLHTALHQSGEAEVKQILVAELRRDRFHQTAGGDDIHGIYDTLADIGIPHIAVAPIVAEGFIADAERRVIIYGSQRIALDIDGRGKGC